MPTSGHQWPACYRRSSWKFSETGHQSEASERVPETIQRYIRRSGYWYVVCRVGYRAPRRKRTESYGSGEAEIPSRKRLANAGVCIMVSRSQIIAENICLSLCLSGTLLNYQHKLHVPISVSLLQDWAFDKIHYVLILRIIRIGKSRYCSMPTVQEAPGIFTG